MGLSFHPIATKPNVWDIVWSLWPERGGLEPGPVARPVLVVDVEVREDQRNGIHFASIIAQYGGSYEDRHIPGNLLIGPDEFAQAGLHKPTLFRIDLGNRKRLPWATKYFVPQAYVRHSGLIAGSLNQEQVARALDCFKERGLTFPLPLP